MNKCIPSIFSAVLGLGIFLPAIAGAAPVTHHSGDLLMGFRATDGLNSSICYVVNLGSAASFRDGTVNGTVTIPGNIGTDLATIYGADWRTRPDLFWSIAASPSSASSVNGDARRTVYVSKPGGGVSDGYQIVDSLRASVSGYMVGLQEGVVGFRTYQATTNSSVAASQNAGDPASWAAYMNGGSAVNGGPIDFGAFDEIESAPSGSLSLYRLSSSAAGSYVGSFSINAAGQVSFTPGSAPVTYASWAATNAGGQTADLDFDRDGLSNGVEYFMGTAGNARTPVPSLVGGGITWPRSTTNTVASFKVQTSTNLSVWDDVAVGNSALTTTSTSVHFALPSGQSKLFVRLLVIP